MEAKFDGFFSTVTRLLEETEVKSEQFAKIQNQIEDHKNQLKICQKVDVKDFNSKCLDEKLKYLLICKISEKISDYYQKLSDISSSFEQSSDLLAKKLEKIIEVQVTYDSQYAQFLTYTAEICEIFKQFSLKFEYLIDYPIKNDDNEGDVEEDIDESDYIFKHMKSLHSEKPLDRLTPDFRSDHKETIECK